MTIKKILFGEKALTAMKESNGLTVIDGRLRPCKENSKARWEFAPYDRKNPRHLKMRVLKWLPEGWIKRGVRRTAVYASGSNKLSPEELVEQLKRDICNGLDELLKEGGIEDIDNFFNMMKS